MVGKKSEVSVRSEVGVESEDARGRIADKERKPARVRRIGKDYPSSHL